MVFSNSVVRGFDRAGNPAKTRDRWVIMETLKAPPRLQLKPVYSAVGPDFAAGVYL
jgi:hypothetical protein